MSQDLAERSSFKSYLEIVADTCCRRITQEAFDKSKKAQDELQQQTLELACRLEEGGVSAFDENADFALVGLRSRETKYLDAFRQIVFLPAVAKKKRNARLKVLEYFLDQNHNHRMWVFNLGLRVGIGEVRQGVKKIQRALSRFSSEVLTRHGISLDFRSTELGSLKRDRDGLATFHIHVHALVATPYIKDYTAVAREIENEWAGRMGVGHLEKRKVWHDAGTIFNPRELCKYVVKPSDLFQLSPEELCHLHEEMFQLHIVQFSGRLQQFRKSLDEKGVRPFRRPRGDSWVWSEVPTWNRMPEDVYKAIVEAKKAKVKPTPKDNRLLALLAPSFVFDTLAEPVALVARYNGNFHALMSEHDRISETVRVVEDTSEMIAGRRSLGGDDTYTVHNRSETVGQRELTGNFSQGPPGNPF